MTRTAIPNYSRHAEKLNILLVDDDAIQRELQREVLSDLDADIDEACNGLEALKKLEQQDFDVVLLDKSMPEMDGYQVCHEIRNRLQLPFLPVIMVTGSNASEELSHSLDAGATDFISKPYQPEEMLARVMAAVRQKKLTDQLDHAETILFALARMVEAKDGFTGQHCSRLVQNSHLFGASLGLDEQDLQALRFGGVLHDIGKLAVPDAILEKTTALTDSEWSIICQHPVIGADLCSGLNSIQHAVPIIRHHHERWDGSGYPDGLRGEEIPLLARILQLVDIYDALYFERPYKEALSHEESIRIMLEEAEKGWRDPELTRLFVDFISVEQSAMQLQSDSEWDLGNDIFQKLQNTGVLAALK